MIKKFLEFLHGKKPFFFLALYFSDVVIFGLSMLISYFCFNTFLYSEAYHNYDFYMRLSLFAFLVLVVNYSAFGLYDEKRNLFDETQFMCILYSIIITYGIILALFFLFRVEGLFLQVTFGFLIGTLATIFARGMLYSLIYFFRERGYDTKRIYFFGKNNEELIDRIKENSTLGYKFLGSTSKMEELKKHLHTVDVVFVTEEHIHDDMMRLIIENSQITWKIIPSAFNLIMDKVNFDEFKDYPVINIPSSTINKSYLQIKRLLDMIVSAISLLMLSPLFIIIIFFIKLTMPGPIFYKHERIGKNMKPFMLYKFRTMVVGADKKKKELENEVEGLFKMKRDPRVTSLGHILRRTCVDELPQLINIFKGDMSIVGPRPHLREELGFYKSWRSLRFQVKPGLTGMWQVSGRHELNFDKAVMYDIYYIKHMSIVLDISIIFKTIPSIIFSRGRY